MDNYELLPDRIGRSIGQPPPKRLSNSAGDSAFSAGKLEFNRENCVFKFHRVLKLPIAARIRCDLNGHCLCPHRT